MSLEEVKKLTLPQLHAISEFLSSEGEDSSIKKWSGATGAQLTSHDDWVKFAEECRGDR